MRNFLRWCATCFTIVTFLPGCYTGRQLAEKKDHPKFIDGIFLAHKKTTALTNVVSTTSNISEPSKLVAAVREQSVAAKKDTAVVGNSPVAVVIPTREPEPETKETNTALFTDFEQGDDAPRRLSYEGKDSLTFKYADLLNIDPTDIANFALYQFIDQWYGVDYRLGGMDETGIDCSAFSQKLYSEIYGIDLLRTARQQHRTCKKIKRSSDAVEGDLVFFHVRSFRVSHVGVYLKNDYFVHASASQGIVISNLRDKYWRRRYASCGRVQRERETDTEQ